MSIDSVSPPGGERTERMDAVYVYQAPVRLWHWATVLSIIALCVTGYLIGSPLPSIGGEAYNSFLFGWIRFIHFAAAYIVTVAFLFRIYWAFAGNKHASQIFLPPVWRGHFWRELWHEIKWYAMIAKEPHKFTGHNPLATLTMHIMFVWGMMFMILTGFALYGEGTGMGTWQYDFISSWVLPMLGGSLAVHNWHHLGMWVIICFAITHIYAAVREDIMSRQSIISSMFSGWRQFRDSRPIDED